MAVQQPVGLNSVFCLFMQEAGVTEAHLYHDLSNKTG